MTARQALELAGALTCAVASTVVALVAAVLTPVEHDLDEERL